MIKKLFLYLISFFFCLVTLFLIQKHNLLKPNFVDEQDNFVVAKNLINGNKLYANIFSHHQPGTYLLSSAIQEVVKPNSIEMLIKRHRQFIIFWSAFWLVFIVWRFGFKLLIPLITLEFVKNIYLGNLFLAESLVFAPLIYLVLSFLKPKLKKPEIFLWGIGASFVGLNLAPLWPVLALMILIFFYKWRHQLQNIVFLISGALSLLLISSFFIDFFGYWQNAILINQQYYIAIASQGSLIVSLVKSFLSPILYLKNGFNPPEVLVVKFFILILLAYFIYLLKQKKWSKLLLISTILALVNLRNFEFEKIFYDGFHLLIWVGLIFVLPISQLKFKKLYSILLFPPLLFLLIFNFKSITSRVNYIQDFEIYYSRIFNMSEAIRFTKKEDDCLLSMPDEVLVFWQSDIKSASRFIFFYKWMTSVDVLKNEQVKNINSQPEYLLIKGSEGLTLTETLKNYRNFSYRGSKESEFFIRTDVYQEFSQEKIDKLDYYGLKVIN